ncbi:unnamed protein product [Taenia asiatica]|uniref:Dynein light chain n=1 Tax=Taenia asiatica TaxID=60517 RepID=A0A0R3W6Q6_TAEAS|nr:unnamed protein product [Taenia asiatica]
MSTRQPYIVEQTDLRGPDRNKVLATIDECIKQIDNPMTFAKELKDKLDDSVGQQWHVVVGTDYAAFMSFSPGSYMQVRSGDHTVLMYRLH